ncbi:DivIVA domain-containing protein [Blastococcus sp. PRF04-17]|uniref:DivIVA domain-containing protein n=1 Tax=Blastococcus sp. PRF04-17 TaxID=2933797 RepID=UPI001FF455FF|nr:DivIVA domain-containing protein [Blastococcus sp. PRF04-17]UOY02205.1 DivIVA domain-containing protein [Blastococcus sp. PRF04-17]
MSRRATGSDVGEGEVAGQPNFTGDLDELLDLRPVFRTRPRGYDRLQVDNYAAWAESELATARRQIDHLLSRFGACSAELEISRRLLAEAPRGREVYPVSERVEEMMRLASEEAAALTEAGAREAEQILAEARVEADARLRKAHEIKELAVASADELLEHARRERAAAAAQVDRARSEAEEILAAAAQERQRLDDEAAQARERADRAATEHLLAVQQQVDNLRRQRDEARQMLRRLTDQIGEAIKAVLGTLPEAPPAPAAPELRSVRMVDNIVADDRTPEEAPDERVLRTGRPQPVPS